LFINDLVIDRKIAILMAAQNKEY